MRRASPKRTRSPRRDFLDHLQPQPALLLFPQDAAGRTRTDPLLRLGAEGSGAVLRPHRLRRPDLAARRAAAREPRSPHPCLLPAAGLTEFVAPAKAEGQSRCLRIAALGSRFRGNDGGKPVGGLNPEQLRQQLVADETHAGERVTERHAAPMRAENKEICAGLLPARTQLLIAFLGPADHEAVAQQRLKGLAE